MRLPLSDPQAQKIFDQHMMEFLNPRVDAWARRPSCYISLHAANEKNSFSKPSPTPACIAVIRAQSKDQLIDIAQALLAGGVPGSR
jgi:hypothetical protein